MTKSEKKYTFDEPAPSRKKFDHEILITYSKNGPDLLFKRLLKPTNLESRNEYNQTLLHLAVCARQVNKVRFLLERGANTERYVDYQITIGVDKNTKREIKENYFLTPLLTIACRKTNYLDDSDKEIVELLVKSGADINAGDLENRDTPLHWAVLNNNFFLVKLLLELGADPNIKDSQEYKPEDYAENDEIFELFQKHQTKFKCVLM